MKILSCLKRVLFPSLLLFSSMSWAVPIGIIDSGTDLKHHELINKSWTNNGSTAGYKDDKHGWNFAENNNQIIDYSYLGKFSKDVSLYFELQLKVLQGTATDEDKKWMQEKRKDKAFVQELAIFGNFVHGTHVAGIASRSADQAQIMAAKIIPTNPKVGPIKILSSSLLSVSSIFKPAEGLINNFLMNLALGFIAGQQAEALTKVSKYVDITKMKVANCSFGINLEQAKVMVGVIAKELFKTDLPDDEAEKYARNFMQMILEKGVSFSNSAQNTFFVMAAGNEGKDNDLFPIFPGNLKQENTITVAATRGYDRLASFSNFGKSNVEIAAPGVGIKSSIPGDAYLQLSGTSQAAPFVTHIVGKMLDINPGLSFASIKKILMQTVDKKSFLDGKVISGGIANEERAIKAALYSLNVPVDSAIKKAHQEVADVNPRQFDPRGFDASPNDREREDQVHSYEDGEPILLPSPLGLIVN